jgi:hypothetical protein
LSEVANVTDAAPRKDLASRTIVMERGKVFVPLAHTRVATARSSSDHISEDDTGSGLLLNGVFFEYLAMSVAI